jgi:hypothetical protein
VSPYSPWSRRDHRFVAPRKQKCIGSPVGRCSSGDPGIVSLCFYKQVCFITHNTDAVRNAAISMNKTGFIRNKDCPSGAMKKSCIFICYKAAVPTGNEKNMRLQGYKGYGSYGAKNYVVRCVPGFVPGPGGATAL